MSSCRCQRGFASLTEEQLQKLYFFYAGEGFPPTMTLDLNQNLTNLKREHCLRNGGADFGIFENNSNYLISIQGNSEPLFLHKCLALATCIRSKSN